MKSMFFSFVVLIILTSNAHADTTPQKDQNYSCAVTSENKRYEDLFIIEIKEKSYSHIKYKRKHLAAPAGEYGELEFVRGCYHGVQTEDHRPNNISFECDKDGEEGIVSINKQTLKGEIYFYMPKIGYGERTLLEIECEKI